MNSKSKVRKLLKIRLTVAGVVAALLFGFGQVLIENLAALRYDWSTHIIAILLIGILASLASIVLSVIAFRVQNYSYVIGHTVVQEPSLRQLGNVA